MPFKVMHIIDWSVILFPYFKCHFLMPNMKLCETEIKLYSSLLPLSSSAKLMPIASPFHFLCCRAYRYVTPVQAKCMPTYVCTHAKLFSFWLLNLLLWFPPWLPSLLWLPWVSLYGEFPVCHTAVDVLELWHCVHFLTCSLLPSSMSKNGVIRIYGNLFFLLV